MFHVKKLKKYLPVNVNLELAESVYQDRELMRAARTACAVRGCGQVPALVRGGRFDEDRARLACALARAENEYEAEREIAHYERAIYSDAEECCINPEFVFRRLNGDLGQIRLFVRAKPLAETGRTGLQVVEQTRRGEKMMLVRIEEYGGGQAYDRHREGMVSSGEGGFRYIVSDGEMVYEIDPDFFFLEKSELD